MATFTTFNFNNAKRKKTDLVAVTKVHVETIGLYSTKIKSIKDLKVGAKIAIPSDSTMKVEL